MSQVHLWGESITERQARLILPLLVRQALAGQHICYGQIADELDIGHSYLGDHLGIIADALNALARQWGEEIPPIQALVLRKDTRLPGDSFGYGVPRLAGYGSWPKQEKLQAVAREHAGIFNYDKWPAVLAALGLSPAGPAVAAALLAAAAGRGSGEGERHRRLKEFVAANPALVDLPRSTPPGSLEYVLPSADAIDILFINSKEHVAVEVKASNAGEADILRGLFQCVKYTALLKAVLAVKGERPVARAVLALEASLPEALIPVRNTLGIRVFEGITPPES
jgi:hypothetical protein